ncbi:hypothetical protein [Planktothrix agardhii]|jgi:hypothetical protein|uniref:Uncharacterized protein n=1 Tax=Planktothrix agardhii TaxID=1160 RepID=A0A1J1JHS4_PLAAG|nr:hypothetical protein [Planktothrix agardhii]MCF3608383.1 hypothetical protein [Planktothrix agardhii 1033]BBD54581.1 hypothetical protein NIES204_18750 [Planktothrix agardhii NIES-204]MCB8762695.1 hypothetical protein [Planktothrix agardhii 1809]MCB8763671.1 hypothetical protein [Planktothrix agardhii 1809]MCB8776289.1 hypothetical protein [Planktothrix agardhii 1031]
MSKKMIGGILVFLGFMMSPLCWWNDLIFNLPIAYGFGYIFSKLSQDLFFPSSILGYWLSNLVGILLMQYGAMNVVESSTPERNIKKDLAIGVFSSTAFTLIMVALFQSNIIDLSLLPH